MQARYWLLTIPHADFVPFLHANVQYIKGQVERGANTGYLHWQLLVAFKRAVRLAAVKSNFGDSCHAEPSKSSAANEYVWKDDTAVNGTRFELGSLAFKRACSTDWSTVVDHAKSGSFDSIPPDIVVRYYGNLRRIASDHSAPLAIERQAICYWGRSGAGKSRRAWDEAGLEAYPKDPRTKFWDGYRGQTHVVVDEFRGGIDISHLLRWLDRYPCLVEIKGSSTVLKATKIWFTSNIPPEEWYPDLDQETVAALRRRLNITHFNYFFSFRVPWGLAAPNTPAFLARSARALLRILNQKTLCLRQPAGARRALSWRTGCEG